MACSVFWWIFVVLTVGASDAPKRNILFIAVDDLRPWLNCYGHAVAHTPNVDRLASEGVTFTSAFVQYSYCAPSRNSFMSGRRPDTTRAWNFLDHFREEGTGANWTALPEHFKNHGFFTVGAGKLFHPNLPPHYDPPSWEPYSQFPYVNKYLGDDDCRRPTHTNGSWCSNPDEVQGGMYGDRLTVNVTIQHLQHAATLSQPFFIGAGFHRPHMPWAVPQEFLDLYNGVTVPPPEHPLPPQGMPPVAWHSCNDGAGVTARPANESLPLSLQSEARKYYLAAVSFADSNVGLLLDELDRLGLADDTAVVVFGDHGWQLGEHNEWCKMTAFELGVKTPFVWRVPWLKQSGVKTSALAELVDLFPTLSDLMGLPRPTDKQPLEGTSLLPVLQDPTREVSQAAFSQMARCWRDDKGLNNGKPYRCDPGPTNLHTLADMCDCHWVPREHIDFMGYSIRTNIWRYTEWVKVNWNGHTLLPDWNHNIGTELYDHQGDDGSNFDAWENINVVDEPKNAQEVKELSRLLRAQFNKE